MAPKMHELIAVNSDIKGQANKTRGDLLSTFNTKRHLFTKKIVTFKPVADGTVAQTEAQSDIQTTLTKEISWVQEFLAKAIDSTFQIDTGNTQAKADIVVGDDPAKPELVIKDIPAMTLLELEKHLAAVRELAIAIPTLDPAQGFQPDAVAGKGIWKAKDVNKERTKKIKRVVVLAPATDKHPAQVVQEPEDVVTGTILEQEWSALTTPSLKSQVINRCDTLLQAVKKARSRANSLELDVTGNKIGKKLLDYVFQPLA